VSKRTTVRDVAAAAGVSPGTVSKVLNGNGVFRLETRRAVFQAARELGFRPSLLKLSAEPSDLLTIGILTSDVYGRFTLPIMRGVEESLGSGAVSAVMSDRPTDLERERFYLRYLFHRRVDGVIIAGKSTNPRPSLGRDLPFPIMYAYQPSDDPEDCSLVPDHEQVARLAIERLLKLGRTAIAHVSGPPTHAVVQIRARATERVLAEAGLRLVRPTLAGEWTERWGRDAVDALLAEGVVFDAIFCSSDELARGVVTRLRERQIIVPDRVAVIGVDNWTPLAEAAQPPLTTVDLQLRELGRAAGTMLVKSSREGATLPKGTHRFTPRLVLRRSA
jgi:LacI family transcriptional regulator